MADIPAGTGGPLPFSSDDSSILLKSTLDSASAITSPIVGSAGTLVGGANLTFESGRGVSRGASPTGVTWTNLTGFAQLDSAGQISFEIEAAAFCTQGTVYGSLADAQDFGWAIVWTPDGGTTYGNLRTGSGDPSTNILSFRSAGETNGSFQIHSQTKGPFVRVTISWNGANAALFVNGAPIIFGTAPTRNARWANQFSTIWVGHFNGGNGIRNRFIRNLLVSTKPAALPLHPIKKVAFYGHSYAADYVGTNNQACYDDTFDQMLNRQAALAGYQVECFKDGVGGGYVISALVGASLQLNNATYLNSLASRRAKYIVIMAGTNDVSSASFTASAFDTDYKAMLTTISNGHSGLFPQYVYVTTVPSRSGDTGTWGDDIKQRIRQANAVISGLPTWWNSTFPARANQLKVIDFFEAWGGMDPTPGSYAPMAGLLPGATSNLHPVGVGTKALADRIFQRMAVDL